MNIAIGIDVGATRVKVLAVTPAGRPVAHAEASTTGSTRRWQASVRRAVAEVGRRRSTVIAAGVAAPGLASPDHRSIACMPERLPGIEGLDWQEFFAAAHAVPVVNDAQAALLGEAWLGAARGTRHAVLLTLGTGVGGAAMIDGRLLRGRLGRAGHFGHMSLDPAGAPDIVGTPGSLEDAIGDCSLRTRTGGRFSSTKALVAACRGGDPEARRVWASSVRALAAAVASIVNALDPEIVVIGGGIARSGPALFVPLRRHLERFEWRPQGARVRVVAAALGDRAGAYGAAWLGLNPPC
jgi:glucokinase